MLGFSIYSKLHFHCSKTRAFISCLIIHQLCHVLTHKVTFNCYYICKYMFFTWFIWCFWQTYFLYSVEWQNGSKRNGNYAEGNTHKWGPCGLEGLPILDPRWVLLASLPYCLPQINSELGECGENQTPTVILSHPNNRGAQNHTLQALATHIGSFIPYQIGRHKKD